MENQINVGDQTIQQLRQIPEKPRMNYWMVSTVLLVFILVLGGLYTYKFVSNQSSESLQPQNAPTPTTSRISRPSPTFYPTPTTSPLPSNINLVPESITLKVAAIGGGAGGDRYDYVFTFNADPEDKIVVLKRDLNEIKNFPGYNQGAFDKGMVIKHGTVDLEITPSFEGAGITPLKNKNPVIISNIALTDAPIYRISQSNIDIRQGANYTPRVGSYYTLWYKEKPEDCSMLGEVTPPACVFSAGVTLRDEHDLSIFCTAEDDRATWCDNIVKSLTVSVSKYAN